MHFGTVTGTIRSMSRVFFILLIGLLSGALVLTAGTLFLSGNLGSDYTYFLPRLLYGYFWFMENGAFSVPWFSPAWCGGMPFFADPQVMYYSVPQWLTFISSPEVAVLVTFLLFASIGGLTMYLLLRNGFELDPWLALTGAALFAFNEFFLVRMTVGQLTNHAFMLIPMVAWQLILSAHAAGWRRWALLSQAALVFAYVVYAGAANLIVPFVLAVAGLMLIYACCYRTSLRVLASRLLVAGVIGACISSAKLVAGYAFISGFPRDGLSLGVFPDITHSLVSVFTMLFLNPWLSLQEVKTEILVQAHELRFGVTVVPLLLLLPGVFALPRVLWAVTLHRLLCTLLLLAIMAVPIVLSTGSEVIQETLKPLPYFRELGLASRWLCLLIPIVIVVPLLLVGQLQRALPGNAGAGRLSMAIACLSMPVIVISYFMTERTQDYPYNPDAVIAGYERIKNGGAVPTIEYVEDRPGAKLLTGLDDAFIRGRSSRICYQPIFGYKLERFPLQHLHAGPVYDEVKGYLNIKNPACYLYPAENQCSRGDHFRIAQSDYAAHFLTNQPFPWHRPFYQQAADLLSVLTLLCSMLVVLLGAFRNLAGKAA